MRPRAIIWMALAWGAALTFPVAAEAKGPPCPPGKPVEAHATFKERANPVATGSGITELIARVSVSSRGDPLRGQVPYIGLVRRGTEHPGGYLYFARRATDAAGMASITVNVPSRGRWSHELYACADGELQQSGPIPADGAPTSPPRARASGDRGGVPAGDDASWSLWIGIAAALGAAAAIALMISQRARARA
jgi:hypothetical protein